MGNIELNLPPAQPNRAELFMLNISVIAFYGMAVIVTTNVISRWIGRPIIPDDILLVQELMVIVIMFPLALITACRLHISVDVFTEGLDKKRKTILALLEHSVGLIFLSLLAWAATNGMSKAWSTQEYYSGVLDIPVWIGHFLFTIGILFFLFRLAIMAVYDFRSLLRGV